MFKDLLEDLKLINEDDALNPQVQAIIMELAAIQKKTKALEAKLAELKDTKKELSSPVIQAMQQLKLQNVRVDTILVSLVQGKTAPSFNAVYDAVKNELAPAVQQLLEETYEKLIKPTEPYLKIKNEKIEEGIGEFISSAWKALIGKVSTALGKIEALLK